MFFRIDPNQFDKGPKQAPNPEDVNPDGSPKYVHCPDGTVIINDPSLLISKELHDTPPSQEDLDKTEFGVNGMWIPLQAMDFWNTQPA